MHKTSEHFNKEKDLSLPLIKTLSTQPGCQPKNRLLKNYYEIALYALHAGVWSWEPDEDQLYWSEKCFEITGINEAGANTNHFYSIIHPSDKERLKLMWSRITAIEGYFDLELRIIPNEQTR